jgi:hypothetical protein
MSTGMLVHCALLYQGDQYSAIHTVEIQWMSIPFNMSFDEEEEEQQQHPLKKRKAKAFGECPAITSTGGGHIIYH